MPYIDQAIRASLEDGRRPTKVGELNYIVTRLIDAYLMVNGLSYTQINAVIGVLECAKMELYRRIAAPYEDKKSRESGDVYVSINNL
jgi:hypothetical protein